jgi:hypothetical protein
MSITEVLPRIYCSILQLDAHRSQARSLGAQDASFDFNMSVGAERALFVIALGSGEGMSARR